MNIFYSKRQRDRIKIAFLPFSGALALLLSFGSLIVMLEQVFSQGSAGVSLSFLQNFPSRFPEKAGIKSALAGTFWLMACTTLISVPLGVFSAIYLEEFASKNKFTRFVRANISNLAAVPSIVYGLLGLAVFVRWFSLDRSVLAGALTMSLLILPVIIISGIEALRAVPDNIRQAAFGVGGTRSQVVFQHVLPQAFPGMITGVVLALSRAVGETAPLIAIGALAFAAFTPEGPMDEFTTLSIQIFNWAARPQAEFHDLAASAIIVLLVLSLGFNAIALFLRLRILNKRRKWA